ncbi:YadA C-terminal domain-containing protein [Desulfogranum mediterraneum]|uniref:YadA C-terminal domain-containing protein n=1 Tax=Desulfogranum mediterraneum TaxID=160661 RepID=UPI00041E7FA2|nr:YadA C-terminal domain-containing protein [Desulfogranum mediterraneum]
MVAPERNSGSPIWQQAAGSSDTDTDGVNLGQLNSAISSTRAATAWLSSAPGGSSTASGSGSIASGPGASSRTNDTAIGAHSTVSADGGTAIGQNARIEAGASSSVALGKDSVASEPNTVSVGSPGNERRLTNLAPGLKPTDAVNRGQLDRTNARVATNSQNIRRNRSEISHNRTNIQQNREGINSLSSSLDELRNESRAGIAAAAALIELMPSAPGKITLNLGSASFKGEVALGLTAVHRLEAVESLMLNTGLSVSNDAVLVRAGVSWEF